MQRDKCVLGYPKIKLFKIWLRNLRACVLVPLN